MTFNSRPYTCCNHNQNLVGLQMGWHVFAEFVPQSVVTLDAFSFTVHSFPELPKKQHV